MAGFSFGGLATGLDTGAIINQLLLVESRPLQRLQNRRSTLVSQQGQFSTFKAKLQSLSDKITGLNDVTELSKFKTTSSEPDAFTVSASGLATAGTHTLSVSALASAKSGYTTQQADKDQTGFGSGTIDLTVDGNTIQVAITAGTDDTLEGIRDAVNAADAGVQASIIDDGTGFRLVLNSSETGTTNAFTVTTTGLDATGTSLFAGFTETAASDATFTLDNIAVTSATNSVADVIDGITLDLRNTTTAPSSFTVERDVNAIGDRLQEFVDAYNDVISFIDAQDLSSDSALRTIKTQIQGAFQNVLDSNTFDYVGLSQVGIKTTGGRASLDRDGLGDAIDADFGAFINLFRGTADGATPGLADIFDLALNGDDTNPGIISGGAGPLKQHQNSLGDRIRGVDGQIANQERRLDRTEAQLTRRFASFESLTSSYQSQGQFLQQALLGLR